jgi:hypothetical protein
MRTKAALAALVVALVLVASVAVFNAQGSSASGLSQAVATVRVEPIDGQHLRIRVDHGDSIVVESKGLVLTWNETGTLRVASEGQTTITGPKGEVRMEALEIELDIPRVSMQTVRGTAGVVVR